MILSLIGERGVHISDETAEKLDQALMASPGTRPLSVKIPVIGSDKPALVILTTITGLWTDEQWGDMQHEKAGDFKCMFGFWHAKREPCGHRPEPEPAIDLGYLRHGQVRRGNSEYQRKFFELIRFNFEWAKSHPLPTGMSQFGPFRTVEEWDLYQADGTLPPIPPYKPKTRRVMKPKANHFPSPDAKQEYVLVEEPI